jgi:hypothetical protein
VILLRSCNSQAASIRAAEAQFFLRSVTYPLEKFYIALSDLTEVNVDRVKNVAKVEPDKTSTSRTACCPLM